MAGDGTAGDDMIVPGRTVGMMMIETARHCSTDSDVR